MNIITLICKDTIDEKVHNIVNSKQELSSKVVDNKNYLKRLWRDRYENNRWKDVL